MFVVLTHLARSLDPDLFYPATAPDARPRLMQWPVVRVPLQGRAGVALFAFVTGFVCALKPVRLARGGDAAAALDSIAHSAFRRLPRLMLPTALATAVTWLLCQLGAFRAARLANSHWLSDTAPDAVAGAAAAVQSLALQLVRTWTWGSNTYDINQWTMLPLLRISMLVYVAVAATARVRPHYRMAASAALWLYAYLTNDALFGMQAAFGMFLADLYAPRHHGHVVGPWLRRVVAPGLVALGLVVASYPEDKAEWAAWSRGLARLAAFVLPSDHDAPRFFTAFGVQLAVLGVCLWPRARDLLAHRRLGWLGRQSFAVYLLHGPLMRAVLGWAMYGLAPDTSDGIDRTPPAPRRALIVACLIPPWFVLLYTCAALWTSWVDPACARLTMLIENYVANSESKMDGSC